MPVRNGNRSLRGRSAIARRAINTNSTNGMQPQITCTTSDGKIIKPCGYFGGNKKGGSAPNATGFMRPFGLRDRISAQAQRRDFLFVFRTGAGHPPWQGSPSL